MDVCTERMSKGNKQSLAKLCHALKPSGEQGKEGLDSTQDQETDPTFLGGSLRLDMQTTLRHSIRPRYVFQKKQKPTCRATRQLYELIACLAIYFLPLWGFSYLFPPSLQCFFPRNGKSIFLCCSEEGRLPHRLGTCMCYQNNKLPPSTSLARKNKRHRFYRDFEGCCEGYRW